MFEFGRNKCPCDYFCVLSPTSSFEIVPTLLWRQPLLPWRLPNARGRSFQRLQSIKLYLNSTSRHTIKANFTGDTQAVDYIYFSSVVFFLLFFASLNIKMTNINCVNHSIHVLCTVNFTWTVNENGLSSNIFYYFTLVRYCLVCFYLFLYNLAI